MHSPVCEFKEGEEIYLIKYKGNHIATDYSRKYTIITINKEIQEQHKVFCRYATLNNGTLHLLYSYTSKTIAQQGGVTYFAERKQSSYCSVLCSCCS
jgi:hypothetical protein